MNTVYLKLISIMFFWGTAFVSDRVLAHEFRTFIVAFMRFFLASFCLLTALYYKNQERLRPSNEQWPNLVLHGLSGVFLEPQE